MKSLALALASRPQVLENWPVLGSRTALFFELLNFRGALEKFFGKRFFVEIARKIFVKTFLFCFWEIARKIFVKTFFFFWRALALVSLVLGLGLEPSCPWPRECLSSERLSLALASDFFVSLALASSLVTSTPPLIIIKSDTTKFRLRCHHPYHTNATGGHEEQDCPFYVTYHTQHFLKRERKHHAGIKNKIV